MTNRNYITILGEDIDYTEQRRSIEKLKFYDKNPRVLAKLAENNQLEGDPDTKQQVIFDLLKDEPSVAKLLKSLEKEGGGISEPLIVQERTLEVLEGNSRLAALRILCERKRASEREEVDERLRTAPCQLVNLSENEGQIYALLHLKHIEGKTEWTPFDKAYSAYHKVEVEGLSISELARLTPESELELGKQVATVRKMLENNISLDNKKGFGKEKFSYFNLLVRSTKIKKIIQDDADVETKVLDMIKEATPKSNFTAMELRDKVPQIVAKPKVRKKWISGEIDFDEAVERSTVSEPKKLVVKAIRCLNDIEASDVKNLDNNDINAFERELRRCEREMARLKKAVEKQKS